MQRHTHTIMATLLSKPPDNRNANSVSRAPRKGPPDPVPPTGQNTQTTTLIWGSLHSEGQFLSFVHPNENSAFLEYRLPFRK